MSAAGQDRVRAERRRIYQQQLARLAAELDVLAGRLRRAADQAIDLEEPLDAGVLSVHAQWARVAAVGVESIADVNDRVYNGPRKRR